MNPSSARSIFELLEQSIAVTWLVVEEHQSARAHCAAELDRVRHARVAPADPVCVLVLEILRIVNEHVDA